MNTILIDRRIIMIIDEDGTYISLDDVDTNDDVLDTYDMNDTIDLTGLLDSKEEDTNE